jgi:hypothetical protein
MSMRVLLWLKDLGPMAVSLAIFFLTLSFNRWQRRLAREQLRHQLYERRVAVYDDFRELLLALASGAGRDDRIGQLFLKASNARCQIPFLFEDNQELKTYLDQLCDRVRTDVISNIMYLDGMKQAGTPIDAQIGKEMANRATRLSEAPLEIATKHLEELPKQFAPFLKMTDFSKM